MTPFLALWGRWAQRHNTKSFFFFFLNLDTVLSDLTQNISPTCDKLNKTEQDRWSLKQSEFTF